MYSLLSLFYIKRFHITFMKHNLGKLWGRKRLRGLINWHLPCFRTFKALENKVLNMNQKRLFCKSVQSRCLANDYVSGHLSSITVIYASWYFASISIILVLNPSSMPKRTKIGLKLSKTSHIKLKYQYKIQIKMSDHGIKTTNCDVRLQNCRCHMLSYYAAM